MGPRGLSHRRVRVDTDGSLDPSGSAPLLVFFRVVGFAFFRFELPISSVTSSSSVSTSCGVVNALAGIAESALPLRSFLTTTAGVTEEVPLDEVVFATEGAEYPVCDTSESAIETQARSPGRGYG